MLHVEWCIFWVCVKDAGHSYLSSKQCAADRTQQESIRTPPHRWKCFLRRDWYTLMTACHGCSVMSLSLPPNMRNAGRFRVLSNRWPHVAAGRTGWLNNWWRLVKRQTKVRKWKWWFSQNVQTSYLCYWWLEHVGPKWWWWTDVSLKKETGGVSSLIAHRHDLTSMLQTMIMNSRHRGMSHSSQVSCMFL